MQRARLAVVTIAVLAAAPAAAGGIADSGVCARCHETEVASAAEGGHAPSLDCLVCHEDRRPGTVGPGHRTIPTDCTTHHTVAAAVHPPAHRALRPARAARRCLVCHDPHGSTNTHLVRPEIRTRGRARPVDFHDPAGLVDPSNPGHGLCEVCHRDTRFYRANGRGEAHFTDDCTLCHDHAQGFLPVVSDANCGICHAAEAARLDQPNLHHAKFAGRCSSCHAEVKAEPGPGHRATSACADCHAADRFATHAVGADIACAQCHEPHGTDNASLVRDVVHTTPGADRPVVFDSRAGRADGSFASASAPGTGLCETCHTTTQFYRADGTGAPHYTTACTVCHPHAAGFLPR